MFEILLDPPAEQDVDEIFRWYEEQRKGLGFEFLISLDYALELLARNPLSYFNVTRHIRRVTIPRFPYSAYYSIASNVITIHIVMHQHKDPEEWQIRI